jgi:hypothetical protein
MEQIITYLNGTKIWHLGNKPHREDGPVYIGADGTNY